MKKETFTCLLTLQKKWLMLFLPVALIFINLQELKAQCPLACDNLVQVSLDENCLATITADMILEDPGIGCNYNVVVFGTNGVPLPNATVNGNHIGKTLTVSVYYGNNSCWGSIYVEDKLPPVIRCPEPDTVFCNQRDYILIEPFVQDNCSQDVTRHVISDNIIKYHCDSLMSGKRVILYYYSDASGNRSDTCEQCVYFMKIDPGFDVVWPRDTIFDCLVMDTVPLPNITGVPTVAGEPLYPDWSVCKIAITYEDQLLPICPKAFKVLRKWTYIDWCRPTGQNVYIHYQVVKVIDEKGPVVSCAPNVTISTDVWTCTGTALLAPPTIIQECSNTTVKVGYKIASPNGSPTYEGTSSANVTKLPNGLYSISRLPLGLSWVIFQVTDECGNFTDCATEVFVEDKVPPIPVCDQKTVVTLTIDGTAKVFAETFDDRSHDNCGIQYFEAKRMDDGTPCNTLGGDEWRPYVEFCCDDIGKTLMVSMRVWDIHGNSNSCMVEIEVQDKLAPFIYCPPDITVSCEFDYTDLNAFGTVRDNVADRKSIVINDKYKKFSGPALDGYAYDGCGVTITETVTNNLKCGTGTISRKFIATDPGGLMSMCTQIITVVDSTPNNVKVIFPNDYFSDRNCMSKPQLKPDTTGKPTIIGADNCSNIVTTYDDLVFTLDPDACLKILRKWVVIDWCVWNPNTSNSPGYWSWTQVIKITNSVPPTFKSNCQNRTVDVFGPGCRGDVSLVASATDDCTDSTNLVWDHKVDLFNDGIADPAYNGPGKDASGNYPVGVHKVTFTVWDACNNKSVCMFLLTVRDGKKPTPYCIGSIVTTVMPSTQSIEIWAKDFNLNSEDNCTPKDSLKYYFLISGRFEPSMLFTCSNIGKNIIRVYVVDQAGNSDFCEVELNVQDPNHVCPTGITIQGKISTMANGPVIGASATWQRMDPPGTNTTYTDQNGYFTFNSITPNMSYVISADKSTGAYINGVSTYDIVLIQKHILGTQLFDSPYKYLAADVNASCTVTAADISEIRRLILGKIASFDKVPSWKFVPVNSQTPNPVGPCGFEHLINYNLINRNQMSTDFYGVKMGDINVDVNGANLNQASTRSDRALRLYMDDIQTVSEGVFKIPVYSKFAVLFEGMQMELNTNNSNIEFIGMESAALEITNDHYATSNNNLIISITQPQTKVILTDKPLFYLLLKGDANNAVVKAMELSKTGLSAEYYNENLEILPISLEWRNSETNTSISGSTLFQNKPNPFSELTTVSFEIQDNQEVEFIIYEMDGKVIYKSSKFYEKGYHEFELTRKDLNSSGVLFMQMNTGDFTDTKRLVLIK